jgi:pimeloyl-ACP methyl ester carboxylesterase
MWPLSDFFEDLVLTQKGRELTRYQSKDRTNLSYRCSGTGPPVIFVHGSATDGRRWLPILPLFETQFTAFVLDRRGHGESNDAAAYSIEAEFDDIAALTAAAGGPVDVVAHSYGALCALGAACRTPAIRRLVAFEPPLPIEPNSYFQPTLMETMSKAIANNDPEAAVEAFARDALALTPDELDARRRLASWRVFVGNAALILRELRAVERLINKPGLFGECAASTLLLVGGASPPRYRSTAEALNAVLPSSRIAMLPDQGHDAINAAPELFAGEVIRFLSAPTGPDASFGRVSQAN